MSETQTAVAEESEKPSPTRQRLLSFLWRCKLSFYCAMLAVLIPPLTFLKDPRGIAVGAWILACAGIFALFKVEAVTSWADSIREKMAVRLLDKSLGALLIVAVILEVGLTVTAMFVQSPLLQRNQLSAGAQVRIHKFPAGTEFHGFKTNSEGFYDEELPSENKKPGEFRIAAIGDSFTFGIVPHKDNFLTLLEKQTATKKSVNLVNLGVCGVGPVEYSWLYNRYKSKIKPDLVILSVFVGNDLVIPFYRPSRLKANGYYLYLVGYRLSRLVTAAGGEKSIFTAKKPEDTIGQFSDEAYIQLCQRKAMVFKKALKKRQKRRIDGALNTLSQLIQSIPVPVIVVVIPDEMQVNNNLRERVFGAEKSQLPVADYDLQQPNKWIADVVARHKNAVLVDTLPALVEAEKQQPTYEPNDTHWNKFGNSVAAAAIRPALEKLLNHQD